MTLLGSLLITLIVLKIIHIIYQNQRLPSLGLQNGTLKALSQKPNGVSSQLNETDPKYVSPWAFKESSEATMKAIKTACHDFGQTEIKTQEDQYLHVVFSTPLMKFHDDVEFFLNTETQQVHYRSQSRAGYSDLGVNRKRYESLLELYGLQQ